MKLRRRAKGGAGGKIRGERFGVQDLTGRTFPPDRHDVADERESGDCGYA